MMKKKITEIVLITSGLIGFSLLLGAVGGMETGSADFIEGIYWILVGCVILTFVVFVGIPYYNSLLD